MEINIEIDELTPCLLRVQDRVRVQTEYHSNNGHFLVWDDGIDFNVTDYAFIDEYGCVEYDAALPRFSWKTQYENYPYAKFFELFAEGDERPQGRVCLNRDRIELVETAPWNNVWWLSEYLKSTANKEYIGVGGHLFAIAAKEFYDNGGNSDLFFRSIAGLQPHYEEMLGAQVIRQFDGQEMVWPTNEAYRIMDIYFGDDSYV